MNCPHCHWPLQFGYWNCPRCATPIPDPIALWLWLKKEDELNVNWHKDYVKPKVKIDLEI